MERGWSRESPRVADRPPAAGCLRRTGFHSASPAAPAASQAVRNARWWSRVTGRCGCSEPGLSLDPLPRPYLRTLRRQVERAIPSRCAARALPWCMRDTRAMGARHRQWLGQRGAGGGNRLPQQRLVQSGDIERQHPGSAPARNARAASAGSLYGPGRWPPFRMSKPVPPGAPYRDRESGRVMLWCPPAACDGVPTGGSPCAARPLCRGGSCHPLGGRSPRSA
jgi:hypothetical protein